MDGMNACSIVIFGASGDLAQRKLVPALFNLRRKGRLPEKLQIMGYGGKPFDDDSFRRHLLEGARRFAAFGFGDEEWASFAPILRYRRGPYDDPAAFKGLDRDLASVEGGPAGRLYYMAEMAREDEGWRRVVVEKPFGTDLASAQALNRRLHQVLRETQIYRIDHYLGKETVQNILVLRFANTIFEPLWNRNYIDHVQITVAEDVGVEHRGGYYDGIGVLRDMFQNHLLQLATLVALEPPAAAGAEALRNEKVKVLSAVRPMAGPDTAREVVLGQYRGYREEPQVRPGSITPTFGALRLFVANWRWQGVPFLLRSGKKLAEKQTRIVIRFKEPPLAMFRKAEDVPRTPNRLVLLIQPDEGVHMRFEAKVPGTAAETRSVDMEFHYAQEFGPAAIPEAYERLLLDAIQGDASLFTRDDEAEAAWRLIDPIVRAWEGGTEAPRAGTPPLAVYEPGSWGPAEADALLADGGRRWINDEIRHDPPGPEPGSGRRPGGQARSSRTIF
jgi:glucose-6-phosphate 1-dehydrogenase